MGVKIKSRRSSEKLMVDDERNQILTLCEELSPVERMIFLKLYSDYQKRKILERSSDDKIRKFLELHSDEEIKKLYSNYVKERTQVWSHRDDEIWEFVNLYSPGLELKQMYMKLPDDDKEKILHEYNDSWRYKILKYLEFRPTGLHKYDAGTIFDILTFTMKEKEVVLSKDVKEGILELQKGLWQIYNYLRDIEAKYDDSHVLFEYGQQLYLNLGNIADSSDHFLDPVMSNHVTSHDIHTLLQTIHNFYSNNLSSTQFKLELVVKDNINYGGHQNLANASVIINLSKLSNNNNYTRPKSHGHVPNPDLIGFDREIQILLNHLIRPQDKTCVVGIVGAGGSGKTTLAKHIYHHPQIDKHFTRKLWVCISQSWDKTSILNQMWRQADENPETAKMEYDQVVYKLSQHLSSHSYLVILDDFWSIDAWHDISPAFPPRSGSKVVVTTRKKFLPQRIDHGVFIVETKQLNDKECYELFKKRALLDENVHHELKSLGVEMVKKCKGLPLAVVALAGVLGNDKRLSNWERINKRVTHKMLNMSNESTQGVVKEILALSYYELPENLKLYALYLHVFPEGFVIEAQKLVQMWIAESFMDQEYEAEDYIDELAQRYIVEVIKTNHRGQVLEIQIHDLIRQMLISVDKERNILKNPVLRLAPSTILFGYEQKDFDSRMKLPDRYPYRNSHVRSLIFLNFEDDRNFQLQSFIKLKGLRVLILDDVPWSLIKLSEEIANLIHLRYLQLSGNTPIQLLESIGNLANMLTLLLQNLPVYKDGKTINLEKLKELRHLYMPDSKMVGIEKLKKLKTLEALRGEWMLSEMPKLSDVLQELRIWGIVKETELEVVFRTPSITSNNLHTLVLKWEYPSSMCELRDMSMMSKCVSLYQIGVTWKNKRGHTINVSTQSYLSADGKNRSGRKTSDEHNK